MRLSHNQLVILDILCRTPWWLAVDDVARDAGTTRSTTRRALYAFAKEGLATERHTVPRQYKVTEKGKKEWESRQ